jgi:hypothetical protein
LKSLLGVGTNTSSSTTSTTSSSKGWGTKVEKVEKPNMSMKDILAEEQRLARENAIIQQEQAALNEKNTPTSSSPWNLKNTSSLSLKQIMEQEALLLQQAAASAAVGQKASATGAPAPGTWLAKVAKNSNPVGWVNPALTPLPATATSAQNPQVPQGIINNKASANTTNKPNASSVSGPNASGNKSSTGGSNDTSEMFWNFQDSNTSSTKIEENQATISKPTASSTSIVKNRYDIY